MTPDATRRTLEIKVRCLRKRTLSWLISAKEKEKRWSELSPFFLSLSLDCCQRCPKFGWSSYRSFSSTHWTIGSPVSERKETHSRWAKSNSGPRRSLSLVTAIEFRSVSARRSLRTVLLFALRSILVCTLLRSRRTFLLRRTDLFSQQSQSLPSFWFSSRLQSIGRVSCD